MNPFKRFYKPLCRLPIYRLLAHLGRSTLEYYENRNYDMASNGELRVLRRLAAFQPKVVLDVGANVGEWSAAALEHLPLAHVYAFEPAPKTFQSLSRAASDRLTVINKGLSDRDETLPFYYYAGHSGQSSRYAYEMREQAQVVNVPVTTGDAFCDEKGITHIDFLKIDTEGADLDVLRGFARALEEGRVDVIQFEYGRINIRSRALLADFYDYLTPLGYSIGKIFPWRVEFRPYSLRHENFIGPNFLAVRNERPQLIDAVGVVLPKAPKI